MKHIYYVTALIATALVVAGLFYYSPVQARAEDDNAKTAIIAKIDEVLSNQRNIMDELSNIKEELGIIKIRITQNV